MRPWWHIHQQLDGLTIAVLFVFLSFPPGQCTTVVVYRTPTRIVISADTLHVNFGVGTDSICKIRKSGNVYFSVVGIDRAGKLFNPYSLAEQSISSAVGIAATAKRFGALAAGPFAQALQIVRREAPDFYKVQVTAKKEEVLQVVFIGVENTVPTIALVSFTVSAEPNGRLLATPRLELCPGDHCPTGEALVLLGWKEKARTLADTIRNEIQTDPVSALPKLIDAEIQAHPGHVGGPIDTLILSSDGTAAWGKGGKCKQRKQQQSHQPN